MSASPDPSGPETPDATPRPGASMPAQPAASERRYHILTFAPGERFRYEPDGFDYTLVKDARGRLKARRAGSPDALVDLQSFVFAVDPPSGGDFDGLGLSGFDPASVEEGGGL